MGTIMLARDIMNSRVITIGPDATIAEAVGIMLTQCISGLPVVDASGLLVGIVSEGDLLRRSELGTERLRSRWLRFFLSPGRLAEEYTQSHGRKVGEVMTSRVVTASEETPLAEVVELMSRHRVKRIPILFGGGPVGIVSRADVLRALAKTLAGERKGASRSDDAIRADILAVFEQESCIPFATVQVAVRDGEVHLSGTITDERQREAVRVAAENVPGVRATHDHLLWVDPMSALVLLSPEDEKTERQADRAGAN